MFLDIASVYTLEKVEHELFPLQKKSSKNIHALHGCARLRENRQKSLFFARDGTIDYNIIFTRVDFQVCIIILFEKNYINPVLCKRNRVNSCSRCTGVHD